MPAIALHVKPRFGGAGAYLVRCTEWRACNAPMVVSFQGHQMRQRAETHATAHNAEFHREENMTAETEDDWTPEWTIRWDLKTGELTDSRQNTDDEDDAETKGR